LAGPPPKPAGRRQRRNPRSSTERAGPELVALAGGRGAPPDPPAGLLKTVRDSWPRFWASELAQLVQPATDLPALERLWTLYDERMRALRGYRRQRLVRGSTGQMVLSPLAAAMKAFDSEIRALEDRFGLTPMARLRLGVALGEAARSLEDLNRGLDDDDSEPADADPRHRVVDATARPAAAHAGPEDLPVDRAESRPRRR
jgi:P27 family predicted phage terminase small subunit